MKKTLEFLKQTTDWPTGKDTFGEPMGGSRVPSFLVPPSDRIYLNRLDHWKCICLMTRWWFQIFFIFTSIWGRFPFWLIFFRWFETSNQMMFTCLLFGFHPLRTCSHRSSVFTSKSRQTMLWTNVLLSPKVVWFWSGRFGIWVTSKLNLICS